MKKIIVLLIINCFAINYNFSQTFTGYTSSNSGLSNNNVNCVTIDSYGNKWVGIDSGFVKFDGINWTKWYLNNAPNIINRSTFCITIDNQNNKWIGTGNGLFKFDGINITHYTKTNSGLKNNTVYALAIDSYNNTWVGTMKGLYKFDGFNWTAYDTTIRYTSIAVEPIGNHAVWVAPYIRLNNYGHIYKYLNGNVYEYFFYYPNTLNGYISSITFDKQQNIWLCTQGGGLYKFDCDNIWTRYCDTINMGNRANFTGSISFDEFNNKWSGINGPYPSNVSCLMKFKEDTNRFFYSGFCPYGPINSTAIDSVGNKWMAVAGQGLWKMGCQVPATPTALQGSDTVTKGQMAVSFKIAHPNDALYYNWVLPNGFTGSSTSDSIIINIDSNAVSGIISVFGNNSCGNGLPLSFNVTVVASQVGINEETNLTTQISVYPNPVANELNIVNSGKDIVNYEIYNTLGESICKGSFTMKTTVQTANFTKGIYLLKLYNEKGSKFQKVVKQ